MPRVSFLTTNYNKGDVLETSLPSIIANLPADGELIIVDGQSTDTSVEQLTDFAADDDRIQFISCDTTIGEGRQLALDHARGDIVVQQIDTDQRYDTQIPCLLDLFRDLRIADNETVLMTFDSLYISTRETAQRIGGYPPLARVDERVYVDRILRHATPRLLPVTISEELPTRDTAHLSDRLAKWQLTSRDLCRTGFSLEQLLRYNHQTFSLPKTLVSDVLSVSGWIAARSRGQYGKPRNSWREVESWQRQFAVTASGRERYQHISVPVPERLHQYRTVPSELSKRQNERPPFVAQT